MASDQSEDKVLDYFCCFNSYARKTAKLSDQEVGRLFRALMKYNETGERQELAGRESIAFDFIADDIDRAQKNYRDKCAKNRANASNRGQPQPNGSERDQAQSNVSEREQPQPNGSESDQYKYNHNHNHNDNHEEEDNLSPAHPPQKETADATFDRFWEAYPKKQGKGAAKKAFRAAKKKVTLETMLSAVEQQKQSFQWNQNGGQYIPSPARWLSEERWNDEIATPYRTPDRNPVAPNEQANRPLRELMEERKAKEGNQHDGP